MGRERARANKRQKRESMSQSEGDYGNREPRTSRTGIARQFRMGSVDFGIRDDLGAEAPVVLGISESKITMTAGTAFKHRAKRVSLMTIVMCIAWTTDESSSWVERACADKST